MNRAMMADRKCRFSQGTALVLGSGAPFAFSIARNNSPACFGRLPLSRIWSKTTSFPIVGGSQIGRLPCAASSHAAARPLGTYHGGPARGALAPRQVENDLVLRPGHEAKTSRNPGQTTWIWWAVVAPACPSNTFPSHQGPAGLPPRRSTRRASGSAAGAVVQRCLRLWRPDIVRGSSPAAEHKFPLCAPQPSPGRSDRKHLRRPGWRPSFFMSPRNPVSVGGSTAPWCRGANRSARQRVCELGR